MRIGSGEHTYEWIEDWAKIPDSASARNGWAHPGLAVGKRGEIYTFHQGDPTVLVFAPAGDLLRTIDTGLTEGHGLTLSDESGTEYLWIADPGTKQARHGDSLNTVRKDHGQVVKMTVAGEVVLKLERPDHPAYRDGRFSPTAVAVFEEVKGGNGDVWVADGYGRSHVHRYSRFDKTGQYVGSIDGLEGAAGAFACPHSIWIDYRKSEPELYVADRTNRRVQVYDLDGRFKRAFGQDIFFSPSAFAQVGDDLIVGELHARLAVLDPADRLVLYLGQNEAVCQTDGWPNMKDSAGIPTRTNRLEPGKFNSPHGLAADAEGNVYVAEWLIGGRTVKLAKMG